MKSFQSKSVISIDCFGTLIDWENGIISILDPILQSHGRHLTQSQTVAAYVHASNEVKRRTFLPFRDMLVTTLETIGETWGFLPTSSQTESLIDSVSSWPLFEGEVEALVELGGHYTLILHANCDNTVVDRLRAKCGVEFDHLAISEKLRSYTPSLHHYRRALQLVDATPTQALHIAQRPSQARIAKKRTGFTTVHITREDHYRIRTAHVGAADYECASLRAFTDVVFHRDAP